MDQKAAAWNVELLRLFLGQPFPTFCPTDTLDSILAGNYGSYSVIHLVGSQL